MFSQLVLVACFTLAISATPEFYRHIRSNHGDGSINNDENDIGKKEGASVGAGLRSIAQGSAQQAHNAVQNQHLAASQAAYVAKNTLAQAAAGASATAQAALAGKQILLQGLEQQVRDAKVALEGERQQLRQAERAADAAQKASRQAAQHVNVLQAASNVAQAASEQANRAAAEAAGELAAQESMVGSAEQRLEQLTDQLKGVLIDFRATRHAAANAEQAAREAQNNAARAAAAASVDYDGHDGRQQNGNGSEEHHAEASVPDASYSYY
nr:uncharacterized protein LOC111425652 [Onthophagus taurus]